MAPGKKPATIALAGKDSQVDVSAEGDGTVENVTPEVSVEVDGEAVEVPLSATHTWFDTQE